jgi:hypothetical protein
MKTCKASLCLDNYLDEAVDVFQKVRHLLREYSVD